MSRTTVVATVTGLIAATFVGTGMSLVQEQEPEKIRIIPQPLRLLVEVAGQEYEAVAEQPFEVDVAGQRVPVKVTVRPTLRFDQGGVTFDYPNHFTFEWDEEDPSVTMWTVEGAKVVLMVQQFHQEMALDALCEMVADSTLYQFGDGEKTAATMTIGGKELKGWRIEADLGGFTLIQHLLGVPTQGEPVLLMLMDVPDLPGVPTEEWKTAFEYLDHTFQVEG